MIVDQAIFGEVKGGHGLRATSGDTALAAELAPRLDLPDTAPPGAAWSPFVSGFPYNDRYVIARTFWDAGAARAGMVLSHALIAPLEGVIVGSDLRPLFALLILDANAPSTLSRLNVELGSESPPGTGELSAAAAALASRAPGPVVRIGHDGFEPLVVALWGRLWPAVRKSFAFRLSFGPGDLVETPPPALVCTPTSLIARWQGHRLLDRFAGEPQSLAAAMLSSNSEEEPLRAFAEEIGAELSSFGELSLLEQAFRLAAMGPDAIGSTVAAIRLTERLSPNPNIGESGKERLLSRLIQQLETATAEDILPLRNLTLRSFPNPERLWAELDRWVAQSAFPVSQDAAFCTAVENATLADEASPNWCGAVLDGLSGAARKAPFASALWRWAGINPALIGPLWAKVRSCEGIEDRLVKVAPDKLAREAARPILSLAATDRLFRLHGAAASAAYSLVDAARLQVSIEPAPRSDGVVVALRHALPNHVVACAIEIGDSRLVQLAAKAVAKRPSLLANCDLSGEAVREIWSAALDRNPDAWRGPFDPRAVFDALLIEQIDGQKVLPELVGRLSRTPLADLSDFPRRAELWSKLAGETRQNLLRATAAGWLDNAAGGVAPSIVETELQNAILSDQKLDELLGRLASGRVAGAVEIVAALPMFDELRFRRWLRTARERTRPIPVSDAESLGRLASDRRWRGVAEDLMQMLRLGREDVRPALRVCISLVRLLDRWSSGLSAVTASEKWESLAEIAAELYPTGPDQDGLWERAGGRDSDLERGGNGRSQWRDALGQVRRGKGPRIEKLLREMQEDYRTNATLRFLSEDHEFGGRR